MKTALLYTLLIYIRLIAIIIINYCLLFFQLLSVIRTLAIADKTSDVVQALLRLAERCFNLLNETRQMFGVRSPSPLTLLRIIHQIQPLIKGGGYVRSPSQGASNYFICLSWRCHRPTCFSLEFSANSHSRRDLSDQPEAWT